MYSVRLRVVYTCTFIVNIGNKVWKCFIYPVCALAAVCVSESCLLSASAECVCACLRERYVQAHMWHRVSGCRRMTTTRQLRHHWTQR